VLELLCGSYHALRLFGGGRNKMGDGEREERDRRDRSQYYGFSHDELAALPEWQRDAIIRRRIEEDLRKRGEELKKRDSDKAQQIREGKEDCFVASVVYGEANAREVNVLREYRDKVLMQDEVGRRFVQWYYGGGGERIAEFVKGKGRFLISIIRKGLDFVVEDYKQRRD